MRKYLLLFICSLLCSCVFAQERLFTDKEHGGAENGIFGKINDELNVSPTGQLSYEIPIPALPGTGGVKPNISVTYNSSTKNGLAGYGFDITGLSIISRIPSDGFHDLRPTAINFTGTDHFALDGQRLMRIGYSSTEVEYRTESNAFAKIQAKGDQNNPTTFQVHTKSGLIYDYVSVAKALGKNDSDSTLFWLVSKVSDTKGNYFTVTYDGDASTNDFYPLRIDYTGNAAMGLTPYASMRFGYLSNPYAPVTYVNGARVKRSKVLSGISLYMGNQFVRCFLFKYNEVDRKYQLAKVEENVSGDFKNSTQLTWSNIADFKVQNYNYTQSNLIHKATLTVGDFNGDGMADLLVTPESDKAGWNGWKLYISRGAYFEQVASDTWNDGTLEQVVTGDFNGDGYDDVIIKRCFSGKWHNSNLYLSSVDSNGKVTLKPTTCILSLSTNYTIQSIDVNGDGAMDLFAWLSNSKEYRLFYSQKDENGIKPFGYAVTRNAPEEWDRVEFGDFNGDGMTDIMNLTDNGNCIMYSDGYGNMTRRISSTWPNKNHYMELGDFNGDGKTDLLVTGWSKDPNKNGWSEWYIAYSKGDGSFVREYFTKPFDSRLKQLYIADFNGDGYDDFQAIDKNSSGSDMTQPQVYLNDGTGNFFKQVKGGKVYATDKWHFYTGDFNGDGKVDFVCTSDWNKSNWNGYQLYLMPSDKHSLLTGIKDGLGNLTTVDYKYLTDKSVFTRGRTQSYPLVSIGSSWPVVSSVTTPDGIGGKNVVSYQYEDALFHKNGRGLLGFAKCYVRNEATNTLNMTQYAVNTDMYVIAPIYSQTSVNGTKIEECDYEYTLSLSNHIYSYLPTRTHQIGYEFNTGQKVKDVETCNEYDKNGNVTKTTVKDGSVETTTTNTYSDDLEKWHLGRLVASTVTSTNENGAISKKSTFEYDKNSGLLTAETFAPDNSKLGYRKAYVHDGFGNITKSTISPLDKTTERATQSTYDSRGRFLVSSTNSLGFTETSTVDNVTGLVISSKDGNGITTNYTYDKFGSLVEASTPVSKSLSTTGWSAGMVDAPSNALYFTWSQVTGSPYSIEFYDCLGRLLRKVMQSIGGRKVYVDQVYNAKGQVVKTSEPYYPGGQQYWNTNEYDAAGRTITQTAADGSSYKFQYAGLKTVTTDPLGHTETKVSNLNGLLVSSMDNDGTTVVYKYDACGQCIETKGPRTTIRCTYDMAGNRTSLNDPDVGNSQDTYNAFGELVSHHDGHGDTSYKYDAGGRVIQETKPDVTVTTSYDKGWKGAVDQVVSKGSINSSYSYTYDKYGRTIAKHTLIDNKGYDISYAYNSANQVETIKYPNGLNVRNGYDGSGIQTSVSNADSQKTYWKLLSLDARGQVEKEEYGNGLVTTTQHEPKKGTISSISTPGIQNWAYTFDAVGNLTSRRDISRNLVEAFSYDGLNRLTTVRKNGQITQSISYDAAGNITTKSDVGTYSYVNSSNKLSSISNCKRTIATWDAISYNSFDKVTQVVSGGKTMTLSYGPDFSRVMSDMDGVRTYYVDKLFEQKINNTKTSNINYVFAFGKLVAIVAQETSASVRYIHHDHLGSIQAYSDENGKLYQELSYDAWGLRRNPTDWSVFAVLTASKAYNDHGFGGHEHIDLFDLINMDGRMYDPVVGRFISADPFIQSPDFTQSLNRYAYCVNNPLSLIDPSGYNWFSKNWKSLFTSAVGIAVGVLTAGTGAGPTVALLAGAAGGAAGALTGALLNGSNIGQIAKTTFTGAFWGAIGGLANNLAGRIDEFWWRISAHTVSEGVMEGLQGGNLLHGFMMGAASSLGGNFIDKNMEALGRVGEVAANSILSGTLDEIGGGKFANGAFTGAFSILFNDIAHGHFSDKVLKKIYDAYTQGSFDDNGYWMEIPQLCLKIGGEIGAIADEVKNGCAIRLSYALNKAGIKVPYVKGSTFKGGDGKNYFLKASVMAEYLRKKWYLTTRDTGNKVKNGIVYQHPDETWIRKNISGHVDVVYRRKWASYFGDSRYHSGAPYNNYKTDIYH